MRRRSLFKQYAFKTYVHHPCKSRRAGRGDDIQGKYHQMMTLNEYSNQQYLQFQVSQSKTQLWKNHYHRPKQRSVECAKSSVPSRDISMNQRGLIELTI